MKHRFFAMKIHYDHRNTLPTHLKYSKSATAKEYNEYMYAYENDGIGGAGFHECMNFKFSSSNKLKFYIPPRHFPNLKNVENGNCCIFSITYGDDPQLPWHIVGVHARCELYQRNGLKRQDVKTPVGIGWPYEYQAEAYSEYSTLFCSPVSYSIKAGRHTPILSQWGNGLRYLEEEHAKNIVNDAFVNAQALQKNSGKAESIVIERQLEVLQNLHEYYFNSKIKSRQNKRYKGSNNLPDKELGDIGEEYVYNQELIQAKKDGINPVKIEWVSNSDPQSPFDIKTVRKIKGVETEFLLEVKSTSLDDYSSVQISSRQISLAEDQPNNFLFIFLNFANRKKSPVKIKEFSINDLKSQFDLEPVKYRLLKQ
ncbi:DUF3883 domain-containing protein [bacterium]|nr:DUF3883 domain-containing protein [bacterium]